MPTIMNPGTSPPDEAARAFGHALRQRLVDQLERDDAVHSVNVGDG